jgi:biotin synthase
MDLDRQTIERWLRVEDDETLQSLYRDADEVRRANVGDQVHLRGLVEVSNHCVRRCGYCGLNASNRNIQRYRMTLGEISGCAARAKDLGYGTVVLQAGEDYGLSRDWIVDVVRTIKRQTGLAVTLSLGERPYEDLCAWKEAGADRYLLRFETSDPALYASIHPPLPGRESDRIEILRQLRELGYEVGSGVMIGIPGQTYRSLSEDIDLFRSLDLDMIGAGPYIPHPDTPLGAADRPAAIHPVDQVPNTEMMTYKVIALARLACPAANIPSTTALATLNKARGRELGLSRGANVVMPNLTPPHYRVCYEIYPDKACIQEAADACGSCIKVRIAMIGRSIGVGSGGRNRSSQNRNQ